MRFLTFLLCVLLLSSLVVAQQKYLVSPNQEVIPIGKGDNTEKIISDYHKSRAATAGDCDAGAYIGPDPVRTPITSRFGFTHKDVAGQWYVAPASGTIDTIFWITNGSINGNPGFDSTVDVRIFESFITPTSGPGIRPGPYPPPCQSWGYWTSTQDGDQQVAAFREDATDTTWHSTIAATAIAYPGTPATFAPFGDAIWGLFGVPIVLKPLQTNVLPMDILPGGLPITVGDVFFISFRMHSPPDHPAAALDVRFEFAAGEQNTPYPSRNWKFYEHDSGPSNCSGAPTTSVKKGWVARGGFQPETTSTALYNMWYVMTPTTNTPPTIVSTQQVQNSLSSGPQTVSAELFDCDKEILARAGVEAAAIRYSVSPTPGAAYGSESTIGMDNLGGDNWEALIPGQPVGATVQYRLVTFDSTGLGDSTGSLFYKVVNPNGSAYRCDTTLACTPASIHSAAAIDTSAWFLPTTGGTAAGDDGTAGPFSLGGPFVYYGDTVNYAWIGVNGAIALSKDATDTIDVNANGFATGGWDIPQRQHHGRTDTLNALRMPKNFIAPLWADWIVKQDSPVGVFGAIRYFADANKFTVEWDSVGDFQTAGAVSDFAIFRVVLDKTTGTIEFQYDEVGEGGLDTLNLTGIQCDSLTHPVPAGTFPPFNYYNRNAAPAETRLHNGLCIHYIPIVVQTSALDGWNMVSVAATPPSYQKAFLYPTAISSVFAYKGSYQITNPLSNGPGFWVKLSGAQLLDAPGSPITTVSDTLYAGWNMVGSVSVPVPKSALTTTPGGLTAGSPIYSYATGTYDAGGTTIDPGYGYWVRASGAGHFTITSSASAPKETPVNELASLSRISIRDGSHREQALFIGGADNAQTSLAAKYEMPPQAPEGSFDARFASQRMVEIYPTGKGETIYPLQIQTSQGNGSVVKISWSIAASGTGNKQLVLAGQDGKILGVLNGQGNISVDLATTRPVIKVTEGVSVPKEFALSRNYPNPFNPITHFTVEIPKAATVEVAVFDVLGRKIATLMNGAQEAGYHLMEWNGKDSQGMTVPSGMYFIRMSARDDQFSAIQKMMLLK